METLLQSLAMKYGMEKAIQLLGIDKQQQNPKYAISFGGNTLDIGNMFKRAGLNQGIKSLTGGKLSGMLGPGLLLGGALALGYARNPLRVGSMNYNPYLRNQLDYAGKQGYLTTNPSSGIMQYGPNSVLSGQNAVSAFGTNDYIGQLENKMDYFEDRIASGKDYSEKNYEKTKTELEKANHGEMMQELAEEEKTRNRKNYSAPYTGGQVHGNGGDNGGGSGTNNAQHGSSGMSKSQHSAFRAARGSIAGL